VLLRIDEIFIFSLSLCDNQKISNIFAEKYINDKISYSILQLLKNGKETIKIAHRLTDL
jgi:hypothetical protein